MTNAQTTKKPCCNEDCGMTPWYGFVHEGSCECKGCDVCHTAQQGVPQVCGVCHSNPCRGELHEAYAAGYGMGLKFAPKDAQPHDTQGEA